MQSTLLTTLVEHKHEVCSVAFSPRSTHQVGGRVKTGSMHEKDHDHMGKLVKTAQPRGQPRFDHYLSHNPAPIRVPALGHGRDITDEC